VIICNNCGRKFRKEVDLAVLVDIHTDAGEVVTQHYKPLMNLPEDEAKWEIYTACPDCMTDEYLQDLPKKSARKYHKGGPIRTLDELAKQKFVYHHDQILHNGWFKSWPLRFCENAMKQGQIYYAIKENADGDI